MKTGLANDEGPGSQELWDKMDKVERKVDLLLSGFIMVAREVQSRVPGFAGLAARRIHDTIQGRRDALERGVLPHD